MTIVTTKPVISLIFFRINKLSIDVWLIRIGQYLAKTQQFENLKFEGSEILKVVQKLQQCIFHISLAVFMVDNLQNVFMERDIYLINK